MGLFSSSKSSSSTTNNQRQVTQDASQNDGYAVTGGGDVTLTDSGAISLALDFAKDVSDNAFEFSSGAFGSAVETIGVDRVEQFENQAELLAGVAESGRSETSQALDKISTYFFLTVAVMGGLYLVRGKK